MQRNLFAIPMIVALFTAGSVARAGDQNSAISAQRMRTLTRGASTEIDAAVYNPAGLTALVDGFHASFNNMFVFDKYEQKTAALAFEGGSTNLLVPSLMLAYKQPTWAVYFNFTIPAGGGSAAYADGSLSSQAMANEGANAVAAGIGQTVDPSTPITDGYAADLTHDVTGSSMYMGFTLGTAYKLTDIVSVAAAGRFIHAVNSTAANLSFRVASTSATIALLDMNISAKNEYEQTANGFGGIFGIDLTPTKDLNIGLRYETITPLEFKTKQLVNDVVVDCPNGEAFSPGISNMVAEGVKTEVDQDGDEYHRDLPAMATLGIAYKVIPQVTVEADFAYYFHRQADWEDKEDHLHDNWEVSASVEVAVLPRLKLSAGFDYCVTGSSKKYYDVPEVPFLDSYTVAGGLQFEVIDGLFIDAAYVKPMYIALDTADGATLSLNRNVAAIGISYKAF